MKTANENRAAQAVAVADLEVHLRATLADIVGPQGVRAAGWDGLESAPAFLVDARETRGPSVIARLRDTYNVVGRVQARDQWREGLLLITPVHLRRGPATLPGLFRVEVELD